MTIGQWVGQWFGEWFGSGEPAPAGTMSGTAAVALSTAGTATGKGALEGAASVILHSSGDLTVAASGMMSGVATIGVGATGALSSTSTPVTTSDYPFFSKGFWSAGFFSGGFWGGVGVIAAKSGASRLYYYQLQEEELKKYEQEQGKTASQGTGQGEKKGPRRSAEVVSESRKADQRAEPSVIQVRERPDSLPKPIYQGYNRVQFPDVSPLLFGIFTEFAQWELSLKPLQDKLIQVEAANEEDYRVRLLLLLAA